METSTTKYGIEKVEEGTHQTLPAPVTPSVFEIDVQIRTARQFARDEEKSLKKCRELIVDPELAASMVYRLERGGQVIEGPSSMLAEMMGYAWGNLRVAGNVIAIDRNEVIAEGVAIDLEKNVAYRKTVRKSIVDKNNRRYPDSLIELVARAAESMAMRNATFSVIPKAYVRMVMLHAKKVAADRGRSAGEAWPTLVRSFAEFSVSEKQILKYLGKKAADIDFYDLDRLRGIYVAIREGESTADSIFQAPERQRKTKAAEKLTTSHEADSPEPPPTEDSKPKAETKEKREGPAANRSSDVKPELVLAPPTPADTTEDEPNEEDCYEMVREAYEEKVAERLWPVLKKAFEGSGNFADSVRAILSAPSGIVVAALSDAEPEKYMVEIRDSARKIGGKKG